MANFQSAFDFTIRNEDYNLIGSVTLEPNGGKARFGINSIFHPQAIKDGFYEMHRDRALEYAQTVYMKEYWFGRGFAQLDNQQIATKLFDMAVNMGNSGEVGVVQTALEIPVTHKLDQVTQDALNKVGPEFLGKLVATLTNRYQAIHDANPGKYAKVIDGWLARAAKIPPYDSRAQ